MGSGFVYVLAPAAQFQKLVRLYAYTLNTDIFTLEKPDISIWGLQTMLEPI